VPLFSRLRVVGVFGQCRGDGCRVCVPVVVLYWGPSALVPGAGEKPVTSAVALVIIYWKGPVEGTFELEAVHVSRVGWFSSALALCEWSESSSPRAIVPLLHSFPLPFMFVFSCSGGFWVEPGPWRTCAALRPCGERLGSLAGRCDSGGGGGVSCWRYLRSKS